MEINNPNQCEQENLRKFLLSEYDNIAAAHFKTMEMISEFIKHYLTIVAIPFTVVVLLFNIDYIKNALSSTYPGILITPIIAILFWVIGSIGLLMLWHILSLRWDALLYARTINGIRKYFYDHDQELSLNEKLRFRVLPQSSFFPIYREFSFFGPVVLAFAIFNTLYVYVGTSAWLYAKIYPNPLGWPSAIVGGIFFTSHIFLYLFLAQKRELSYLRSNVIGVDIDGVLNLHRDHFCQILVEKTGKKINPAQIKVIPVCECSDLNVTHADEFAVFNDPKYWTEMPVNPDAADILSRLQKSMKLKIHIFTSRPWPVIVNMAKDSVEKTKSNWSAISKSYRKEIRSNRCWFFPLISYFKEIFRLYPYKILRLKSTINTIIACQKPIEKITIDWLIKNNIPYDRLLVEQGSEFAIDPSAHIHNRFYASRTIPIKYFVEDDAIKAEKLAYICDVVFLINHPYNLNYILPSNVIRVNSWLEIFQQMRLLW